VQQSRFLILPWVKVPCLASHLLGRSERALAADWKKLYGLSPLLMETLVEPRFAGTSYRAANWIDAGDTTGRGRYDREHLRHGHAVKRVFLKALGRQVRERLRLAQ
jgi:hypothetical protein